MAKTAFSNNHIIDEKVMSNYYNKTLEPLLMKRVELHFSTCQQCFSRYFDFVQKKVEEEQKSLYIGERPVWGILSWDEDSQAEKIADKAVDLEMKGKINLIAISHSEYQAKTVLVLLLRIGAKLRRKSKNVLVHTSADEPSVFREELDRPHEETLYVIAQDISRFDGVESFEGTAKAKTIVIASGLKEDWDRIPIVPQIVYRIDPDESEKERFSDKLEEEVKEEEIALTEDIKVPYMYVCLADSMGAYMPDSLLARLLDRDESQTKEIIKKAKGLIFRVEGKPHLLCTKGGIVADSILKGDKFNLPEDKRLDKYAKIINKVDAMNRSGCEAVVRIFNGYVNKNKRLLAIDLFRKCKSKIEEIVKYGFSEPSEVMKWGKIFKEIGEFEEAERVFEEGLRMQREENVVLLHAYAKLMADLGKYDRAIEYFDKARAKAPENIFVLQAFANTEAKMGHGNQAERFFEEALSVEGAKTNLWVLVSYADFWAKRGNYSQFLERYASKAEELLNKAEEVAKNKAKEGDRENPFALAVIYNVWGEMEKRRGKFKEAAQLFRKALDYDFKNFKTSVSIGVMALERGHWKIAEKCLDDALRIAPENLYALNSMGNLFKEKGTLKKRSREEAEEDFKKAEEQFKKILALYSNDIEKLASYNIETLISYAVLEGERENYEKAKELFKTGIERSGRSAYYIYTAWADIELKRLNFAKARECLSKLDIRRMKTPSLNVFAKLENKDGNLARARGLLDDALRKAESVLDRIITYNTWVEIELEHENLEEANKQCEEAYKLDPENAYTLRAYARMLEKWGRKEEAEELRKKAQALELKEEEEHTE